LVTGPRRVPATIVYYAIGVWPEGERVPWHDAENREQDVGAAEWEAEKSIRRRRWPLRPDLIVRAKLLK